jgi:hypothetical protein
MSSVPRNPDGDVMRSLADKLCVAYIVSGNAIINFKTAEEAYQTAVKDAEQLRAVAEKDCELFFSKGDFSNIADFAVKTAELRIHAETHALAYEDELARASAHVETTMAAVRDIEARMKTMHKALMRTHED